MNLKEAIITAGAHKVKFGRRAPPLAAMIKPAPIIKYKGKRVEKAMPSMAAMQDKYQGCRTQCGAMFDITGKRGYCPDTAIANVYALDERDELVLFAKDMHIVQPRRNGNWYMTMVAPSSGQKLRGVPLRQYETTRGNLVWALCST